LFSSFFLKPQASIMNAVDVIRRLHEHRAWVNRKLVASAERLPGESLRQSLDIGQGSIWKSLLHLYAAEYAWLEALLGNSDPRVPGDVAGKLPGNQEGEQPIRSLDELKAKWSKLESRWQAYLEGLTPDGLDEDVRKITTSGKEYATRRGDVLLHVCTHAHYTAAQVVNMLRQVGAEPLPDAMLISLAREGKAAQRPETGGRRL
jgi:uncharacterized damage-inducible protein DinB